MTFVRQVPPGEVYSYTEGGNGELGFYIVSDGTGRPYKCRVRPPCFWAMTWSISKVSGSYAWGIRQYSQSAAARALTSSSSALFMCQDATFFRDILALDCISASKRAVPMA